LPFVFKNTVFFCNWESATGYELWSYSPTVTAIAESPINKMGMSVYPNPSAGKFQISIAQSATEAVQL
jgi:hypothetical protein